MKTLQWLLSKQVCLLVNTRATVLAVLTCLQVAAAGQQLPVWHASLHLQMAWRRCAARISGEQTGARYHSAGDQRQAGHVRLYCCQAQQPVHSL
jgi:hypothetical protein